MRHDPTPRRGLALVGYRGTGKTTVGRIVAGRLGLPFLDADAELEARVGPIVRYFQERGELAFRDEEEAVLRVLADRPPSVLATGGGAVLRASNREAIRRFGVVVWLTAAPEVLEARLRDDPVIRPALTASGTLGEVVAVLEARAPLYREVADAVVETEGRTPEQVADAILARWGGGPPP